MAAPSWLVSFAFVVLGAPACARPPQLEQPVGFTNVTAATYRAPTRQPPTSTASPQRAPSSLRLPPLLFAENSVEITPEQDADLREIAASMVDGALYGATLVLIGHTTPTGARLENLELGLDRALEVRAFLLAHGAPATQVVVASSGELQTPADWPGRRVDLLVVPAAAQGSTIPGPIGAECSPAERALGGCR